MFRVPPLFHLSISRAGLPVDPDELLLRAELPQTPLGPPLGVGFARARWPPLARRSVFVFGRQQSVQALIGRPRTEGRPRAPCLSAVPRHSAERAIGPTAQ